jgi:hypothetical protein
MRRTAKKTKEARKRLTITMSKSTNEKAATLANLKRRDLSHFIEDLIEAEASRIAEAA